MGDLLREVEDAKREERRLATLAKRLEKAAEKQPVAFARLMVAHALVACEESRERAWAAAGRGDAEAFWTAGVRTAALCVMLCRMAGACGIPEGRWWDASEADLERFWADEERATAVVRAFVAEVRHRPDNGVLLAQLLIADPRVSKRSKDRVATETTGTVAAIVKLYEVPALRTSLYLEGSDLLDVLPASVFDALLHRRPGEGIAAIRNNSVNALRREYEGREDALLSDGQSDEAALAAFEERERWMFVYGYLNEKMDEAKLSPNERQVMEMRVELGNKEIAEITGRSPIQIGVELYNARQKMRSAG